MADGEAAAIWSQPMRLDVSLLGVPMSAMRQWRMSLP